MQQARVPAQDLSIPELSTLRQRLTTLPLPPAVQQELMEVLSQGEEQLRQRLEQGTRDAIRLTLLGELATGVAHDIRNPLNVIALHADIVEEELRQPTPDSHAQITDSVEEIRKETRRLYDVTQDYLALVRLPTIPRQTEDLGSLLEACTLEMQTQVQASGITLHLVGLTRLGRVYCHQGTLSRAFLRLLQRTLDVMSHGAALTIRGRRVAAQASIEITATGHGISEEQAEHLFPPLEPAHLEGLDLGLHVVWEIVTAHDGTIAVQRVAGKDTKFTITLPLAPPVERRRG
jgi:signal transduction histidine kinase